jgi:hypothetical protein
MKKKQIIVILKANTNIEEKTIKKYVDQPPKKNNTRIVDIKIILLYSPKKNKAKTIEENSKLYPATNSDSASAKSNGALLVSASIQIKNITHNGNNIKTYQDLTS